MGAKTMLLATSMVVALTALERAPASSGTAGGDPPVCDPGGPYVCYTTIEFDGRQSYDPDGTIVSYTWDSKSDRAICAPCHRSDVAAAKCESSQQLKAPEIERPNSIRFHPIPLVSRLIR